MNIKIKTKIIINSVCISCLSIIIAGSLIMWRSEKIGTEFLTKTEKERLTSVRYFKTSK